MNKTFIIIMLFLLCSLPLLGCDMFMLQSINNSPIFTLPLEAGEFNDYHDFFENFKSQANQTSGNRDGYGIIAYEMNNKFVKRDFIWYKTGIGNYFNENNIDEPLYEAVSVLYDNPNIEKVLVHARSGTGGNGSHPFIFDTDNSDYTFMHNGYIFNSVKQEIINFLGADWFIEHPSQWEGDYNSPGTFIDSEIIFHYLMYYILQYPDDIQTAFRHAFNNKKVGYIDMEYILKFNNSAIVNFVLSDGINTYAYRSSKIFGTTYNLSYQSYPNKFVAIKTGRNLANTLAKNQLIQISPQGEILDLSIEPLLRTQFSKKYVETIATNQYNLIWKIQSNTQISGFNIYRGVNQNFSNARQISSVLVNNSNQTQYQISDYYISDQVHYYWIEVVYDDSSSEITSNIPSDEIDDEPEIPEVTHNISLYPNPFQDKLNISIDTDQNHTIKVFNLKGQLVDQFLYQPMNKNSIIWDNDSKTLVNGIYILQFSLANRVITKKVMRIK